MDYAQQMLEKAVLRSKEFGIKIDSSVLTNLQENNEVSRGNQIKLMESELKKEMSKNEIKDSTERTPVRTFTLNKQNLGIEINVKTPHKIYKVQVELKEKDGQCRKEIYCPEEQPQKSKLRDCSRHRLKRLGDLYSNTEISSPIYCTENQFTEKIEEEIQNADKNKKPIQKLTKLAQLANEIKNWEDEDEIRKTKNNFDNHRLETSKEEQATDNEVIIKLKWDNNVIQSLEAQDFQKSDPSSTKLSYDFSETGKNINKKIITDKSKAQKPVSQVQKPVSNTKFNGNLIKTSIGSANVTLGKSAYKDPSDMSVKDRIKLFEQSTRMAPILKVPFGMNVPARKECKETIKKHITLKSTHHNLGLKKIDNKVQLDSKQTSKISNKPIKLESEYAKYNLENVSKNLVKKIVSKFEKQKNQISEKNYTKAKSSPKRVYPNLNDFKSNSEQENVSDRNEYLRNSVFDEARQKNILKSTETTEDHYLSFNISNKSINLEGPQLRFDLPENNDNCHKLTGEKYFHYSSDSSINKKNTNVSDYFHDACDYFDHENDDNDSATTNMDSIVEAKRAHTTLNNTNQVKSQLSVDETNKDVVTFVHTISFYRNQQSSTSNQSTPRRKICKEQEIKRVISEESKISDFEGHLDFDERDIERRLVKNKMAKLRNEVCKQQQIIDQTSQALNLCSATNKFSGSTEAVEGVRHSLVATHRRQPALDKIQRLHVEDMIRSSVLPREKGCVTVKEISIPSRQDYVRKLSTDAISGHHLLCLLKYNENVLPTQTLPTLPGLLSVKFPDVLHLNKVLADFRVISEIYDMTAQREIPYAIKYHITFRNKVRTPKKKGSNSRLVIPMIQLPAGPNIARTPPLVQYGFEIFSLREVQKNIWTLTKLSGILLLEGTVNMTIICEVSAPISYKEFLTMFEDISGFDAWRRCWRYLNGHILNFWKYTDDEKKFTPIGSFDLNMAITQKKTAASRVICARLNTIMLECKRSYKDENLNKSSLMTFTKHDMTVISYFLSADTKEERDEWCAYLNKFLMLLGAWYTMEKNDKEYLRTP